MTLEAPFASAPCVLQVETHAVLDIAGAQLAAAGLPVIGVTGLGQPPGTRLAHARWLEIDRRQPAARAIVERLLARSVVILGDGFEDAPAAPGRIRALARPAVPLISEIRVGLAMPATSGGVMTSAAVDIIAGQALALRILAELRLAPADRSAQPIAIDAEATAMELGAASGGHRLAVPPAGLFATADQPIFLDAGSDTAFAAMLRIFNRTDILDDFRYATEAARRHNGEALHALLAPLLLDEPSEVWLERLERYGIPACRPPEPEPGAREPAALVSAEIALELGFRPEQIAGWQQRAVIGRDRLEGAPDQQASGVPAGADLMP